MGFEGCANTMVLAVLLTVAIWSGRLTYVAADEKCVFGTCSGGVSCLRNLNTTCPLPSGGGCKTTVNAKTVTAECVQSCQITTPAPGQPTPAPGGQSGSGGGTSGSGGGQSGSGGGQSGSGGGTSGSGGGQSGSGGGTSGSGGGTSGSGGGSSGSGGGSSGSGGGLSGSGGDQSTAAPVVSQPTPAPSTSVTQGSSGRKRRQAIAPEVTCCKTNMCNRPEENSAVGVFSSMMTILASLIVLMHSMYSM